MSVTLRLAGWSAEGLRCPDHAVNFTRDENRVYLVSLIQMPNGTGKTTTLELLRAALSGTAASGQWKPEYVRSFRKRNGGSSTGRFQVYLLYNARRLTITLDFDFDEGTVEYGTTGPAGLGSGFEPPRELQAFMKPDFVRFFVFDGELASHLLDRQHTDAQRAIEILFQLDLFTQMNARVSDYWEATVKDKGAKEQRGLSRRQNRLDRLKARIQDLTRERNEKEERLDAVKRQIAEKRGRFERALAERKAFEARLTTARQHLQEARHRVETIRQQVLDQMRSPHSVSAIYARKMADLRANLDRVKLPESAAREFFEELAEEPECVCGRPLDTETRAAIRERAQRYFGSDDVALLNALKSDVTDLIGADAEIHATQLDGLLHDLQQAVRHEEECRDDLALIETQAIQGDPRLERAQDEIRRLEEESAEIERELMQYEDPSDSAKDEQTYGIAVLEARRKKAEDDLAEITQTLELKLKTEALTTILKDAQVRARRQLSSHVCSEANDRIRSLMPNNNIVIDRIDRCLALSGQEQGSAGETLSVAYGFLSTLFNRSEHRLFFVVDSPAGPIDLAIRPNIAELIPKLTSQFIAFTISSEREGFVGPLAASADGSVQYLTLFRSGAAPVAVSDGGDGRVVEAEDGVCVEGAEFFNRFQLDEEVH